MSSENIFDLTGRPDPGDSAEEIGSASKDLSTYVINVGRWERRRGGEIAQRWQEQGSEIAAEEPVVTDAHASLFTPSPKLAADPQDKGRAAWWQQLLETQEYRGLHRQTMLSTWMSEIGAAALCRKWAEHSKEHPEDQGPDENGDEPLEQTVQRVRSTSSAVKEAQEAVAEAQNVAQGFGLGEEQSVRPEEIRDLFDKVRNNPGLRQILSMAGRMRTMAKALQRQKTEHGMDDMVGVELAGDINRLVPAELCQAACGVEELELLTLYRIASRRALCREYRGIEPQGRGPVVVCVDESGSMAKDRRLILAKALSVALIWLAHHQRRWICLYGFSGDREVNSFVAPPGKLDQEGMLFWLSHFYNGGTEPAAPFDVVPGRWDRLAASGMPRGRTDHIIITDAVMQIPDQLRNNYLAWREREQVHAYGIVIGKDGRGGLGRMCDRVWQVPTLSLDTEAVQEVLSI